MKQTGRAAPLRIAEAVLTAATLLVAALLVYQCADVFITGTSAQNLSETGVYLHDVYSRSIVTERLSRIAWAFIVWAGALLLVLIARRVRPAQQREVFRLSAQNRLALIRARTTATPEMLAQTRKRKAAAIVCAAVCAACAVPVCIYLLQSEHFASRDLESTMGAMLLHVAPWVAVAFAALMVFAQIREKSIEREIMAAKQAPKQKPEPKPTQRDSRIPVLRLLLYAAAAVLLGLGIANGGMYDVLVKAINICTECIGLG